ncbi:MAG: hypothetical protein A3G38_03930 [Omnitrophica WOR_2 bacterium RIFCSPLOWO2_12_FULL_51_8]|nr:MAG: hypothetical protein A3G38_03930 [Omnitrophica WOR_2 bacterium RIFCSPLOWO2_12_FULL_51_8]
MGEEVKQEEKKCESSKALSMALKVILGLVFLALGGAAIYAWRSQLLVLIKGCVGPFLILAGIITLAIAKE